MRDAAAGGVGGGIAPPGGARLRLFVALTPPSDVQRAVAAAAAPLVEALAAASGGAARPVAPDAVHLTLRFLGDTPAEREAALVGALAEAAAGGRPLRLVLTGAGAFPSAARAQVLWLGLAPGPELDALAALHARVEDACAAAGLGRDGRPFRAHLTVARVRRGARVDRARLEEALGAAPGGTLGGVPPVAFGARALDLVASTLAPGGARHDVRARLPLG